jgi:putative ABC transport system permease protein
MGIELCQSLLAIVRMLLQLMLIGYALIMIFESESSMITFSVLSLMVLASSWISLNTISNAPQHPFQNKLHLFLIAIASVLLGGGLMLVIVTQWVLVLDPWFMPRYMIPLAGMIFATAMTSISFAGERLQSELV